MGAIEFLKEHGNLIYGIAIFFGGIWGTKYMPSKLKTVYKFGLFATIFAGLFIVIEVAAGTFSLADKGIRYLLTYTVVTSAYEMFGKKLFEKWGWLDKEEGGPK